MKTYLATLINAKKKSVKALGMYYQSCYTEVCAGSVAPRAGAGGCTSAVRQKGALLAKVVAAKAGHYATMRLGWAGAGEKHFYLGVALPAFVGDEFQ